MVFKLQESLDKLSSTAASPVPCSTQHAPLVLDETPTQVSRPTGTERKPLASQRTYAQALTSDLPTPSPQRPEPPSPTKSSPQSQNQMKQPYLPQRRKSTNYQTSPPLVTCVDNSVVANKKKVDTLIIGTSIVRNLRPKAVGQSVFIKTLETKTIGGAVDFVKSCTLQPDKIIFQVGSNDLTLKNVPSVVAEMNGLISATKDKFPAASVTISSALPRYSNDHTYIERRAEFNKRMSALCRSSNINLLRHRFFPCDFVHDGIHLNLRGVNKLTSLFSTIVGDILLPPRHAHVPHSIRPPHRRQNF